ncbi:hypothetical protein STCU_01654 [Strigomonas culicis]|uniref:Thioredoxin domain-containing protein n=1 Tax=Strigomonas culicis TaxID=28005 RepID=S9W4P6_9TRYP|nr:hypothetical protein STCU_01654 [Strigomonas culicis]|eukprot:EPY34316.1 hypothetical protein STCU_01654 [Strigomonas culicis]
MSQTQNIIRRIFGDRKLPQNLSNEEYDEYMHTNFPAWMKEFEDSGFLEKTKLQPIRNEEEFIEKLNQHKSDLLVLKFWKHGCIPCLTFAEMYKEAEALCQRLQQNRPANVAADVAPPPADTAAAALTAPLEKRVVWYSVDTKALSTRTMVDYQLISGTPTIQTFCGERQVGEEIKATNLEDLMKELRTRIPKCTP